MYASKIYQQQTNLSAPIESDNTRMLFDGLEN